MSSPPRVVVVGGGQAGAGVAQALAGIADVTLIDPKDYLEIQYANVRVPVDPSIVEGNCVPFKDIPRLGRIVTSAVTSVVSSKDGLERSVTTADGASHPFDFLVLAPGVSYADPLFKSDAESACSLEARRRQVAEAAELLANAGSVVIVGGGPVGVELAAEIADAAADKNSKTKKKREVTLVTSAEHLLHPKPSWVGAPAEAWLASRGVRVVKGQKVEKVAAAEEGDDDEKKKKTRTTKKSKGAGGATTTTTLKTSPGGETLEADVVYWCFNGAPNTSFLSSSSSSDVLDPAGFIRVDEHLRVVGKEAEGWFALGDASSAPGVKLGYLARAQAATVAANVKAAIANAKKEEGNPSASSLPPPSKWTPNNGLEMMLVTLGKGSGTGHLGRWLRFPGLAVAAIKGRDLFVGKTRAGLGVA